MSVLEIMERLLKLENAVIHLDKKIQERDKSCILLEFWIRQKFDYDAQAVSQLMEEAVKRNLNENSSNGNNNNNNTAQETDNQANRNGYEHLLSVLQAPSKSQQTIVESLNHLRSFSFTTNIHDDNRNTPNNNDDDTNVVDHEGKSIDPFDSGVGDNFPLSMEQDYNCDELGMDTKGTKNLDIYDYDESSHGTNISNSTLTTNSNNNNNNNNNNLTTDKIDFGSYFEAESRRGNNSTGTISKTRTRKSKNEHNSGVNCKYCKKDFAKTYIFRHQKKCKWKLAAVASPPKEEQPIESVSQPAEDQKTDPFISAVVMCHGGGENIVSDCGNTNSSASTPVMPMDENSADEEKSRSSATEPKLRFSCKVCSQSFLTLRACRQHIVTEHITHVLNTPLIPSDATFRIMDSNNMTTNINGGVGLPTSSSGLNFNTNLAGPIQNLTNLTLLGLSSSSPGNVMTMSTLQSELRGGGGGTSKSNSNSKDIILKQLFQHPILRVKDKNSIDLSNNSLFQEKKQQKQGKNRGSTPTSTITTPSATNENDDVTTNNHQNQNLSSSTSSNSNQQSNQSKSQGFTYPCLHCKNVNISKNFQNLQDLHLHVLQCHVKKVKFRCPLCYQEFAEQDVFAEHIIKVHRQGLPLLQNENVSTSSFNIVNDESRLNQSYSLPVFNIRGGDSNQSLNLSAIINSNNNLQQQPQSLVVGDFQNDALSNGQPLTLTSTPLQQPLFKCGACSFTFQDFSAAEDHARECHFLSQDLGESRALESSPTNHSNSSSNSNTDNQSVAIDLIRSTFGDNIFMCPGP